MDFRCKTEIKDEPFFESNKDYAHVSQVEETLEERSCDDNVNVKSEIEFEDDPLDIKEEEPSTDQLFGQISELDEKNTNQTVFVFSDAYQGNKGSKGRSNLGSGLQTSETPDQNFKNNHEKNQSWSFSNFGCKSKDMLESSERSFYGNSFRKQRPEIQEVPINGDSDVESVDSDHVYDEIEDIISQNQEESEEEAGEEDSTQIGPSASGKRRNIWKEVRPGQNSQREAPEWLGQVQDDLFYEELAILHPITYFKIFFNDDLLEDITYQSNLYSLQNNPNRPLDLTKKELEQFIGSLMFMSVIKLSNSRMYWRGFMASLLVAKIFSRERWERIKSNIHFNDNSKMPDRNSLNFDKLYKIRPIITSLKEKFQSISKTQRLCIDEQIVPFKGCSSLKQYIPSKPHKWGYKIFILCDTHGVVYDFEIYTGKILPVTNRPDMGNSSNIVLQLAECIKDGLNHQLFFDNWFMSLPLIVHLAKRQIYTVGTVSANRLPGIEFASDKILQSRGRGAYQEKETTIDDVEIRAVKWHDTRSVNLISTFDSAEPIGDCRRYDKKKKEMVTVQKPNIVSTYNSFMEGVDLLDQLISLYRIQTRSKKYYHKFFFHFIDMCTVNSWLLYRRDCEKYKVSKKERFNLQEFKIGISESLLLEYKSLGSSTRGRPSTSNTDNEFQKKRKLGHATKPIPNKSIRTDKFDHMPEVDNRQRCKNPGCKSKPIFKCSKCNVHLCITREKNCFEIFHS